MKKFWLGILALIAPGVAAPASAADLAAYMYPPPLMYDWSGFYIGANGGGGWSHTWLDVTSFRAPLVAPFGEGCHDGSGGVVGGQIGYRWQAGFWVFGF